MIKVTLLGTNGWFDTPIGSTTCTLVQTDDFAVILDSGYGIYKIKEIVDFDKPVYLFITHLHLDHVIGLHVLDYFEFKQPLRIIAPLESTEALKVLLKPPYTTDYTAHPYEVEIISAEDLAQHQFPFEVEALPLEHVVPDTGYRLTIDEKVIAFVLDTSYCENAVKLARGADLLITESGFLPEKTGKLFGHMNPVQAATLAKEAGAKQTLLTHFGGNAYPTIHRRSTAVVTGREICPSMVMGLDGMEVIL
jgi:ribonuclease BN (tRNA processing enzyme)